MTHDPNRPIDRDPTEPVEVQHYGPPHADREAQRASWQAAPAWSSTRPVTPAGHASRRGLGTAPIVAIAVVAGIVSGGLSAVAVTNLVDGTASQPDGVATETPSDADPVSEVRIEESNAVIQAVNRVAPAVVLIQTTTGGVFGGATGTGSGVIYEPDGWILTNRHVVEDAESMIVELTDGRTFEATLYGIDTLTDLAIIRVDATDLPVAPIGSSRELEPGQLAIAIGNPLGYKHTVTTGIVSGLGRQITASSGTQESADTLRNLIQTDAAINPGNSGGPLVNSAGQVIGINTAVSTEAQGLGFAIPVDVAKPIMEQALAGEPIVRPWIGVYYTPISPALAEAEDLPVDYGALIGTGGGQSAIIPGSPAEAAGLQDGDIIVGLNGEPLTEENDLATLILPYEAGDTVTLRILRDNTKTEVEVTLGELPAQ
ncbi:MAG TPA: trypsin-like peptidase domain-containing protein [Candidatus Limnocylindria bacterium]